MTRDSGPKGRNGSSKTISIDYTLVNGKRNMTTTVTRMAIISDKMSLEDVIGLITR